MNSQQLVSILNKSNSSLTESDYSSIWNMIESEIVKTAKELREVISVYTSPQ